MKRYASLMKILFIYILVAFTVSCSNMGGYRTGQRFAINDPDLYLSIAPTFKSPYEFELKGSVLTYAKYSGHGGYNWGSKEKVQAAELTTEQLEKIRVLSLAAIESVVKYEQSESLEVVLDGTFWYLQANFKSFVVVTTSVPQGTEFAELEGFLLGIIKGGLPNA